MFRTTFIIEAASWTPEDDDDMRHLSDLQAFKTLKKLIHKRINNRTEDLVNGKETRDRIDELKDLLRELESYADPR